MNVATETERWLRTATRQAGLLLALFFAIFSCQRESEDPTGGETHFLVRCQPSSSSCGGKLSCLCGVCTVPCAERAACDLLPAAACVAGNGADACGNSLAAGHCDVACLVDGDCAVLSKTHRCELGLCRAGAAQSNACVHGDVSANEVLLVGDSFFASGHQLTAYLEGLARGADALAGGGRYRDNSRLIANGLAAGGIADEYRSARAEAEVKVVIMNGGGADLLIAACSVPDTNCPALTATVAAAEALLAQMAADGVAHVVYAFYPDPLDATLRAKMDAFRPLLESACENSAVNCHFLDLRPTFAGRYDEYIQTDGMNPTEAGSQVSAQAIWAVMQKECIAQ